MKRKRKLKRKLPFFLFIITFLLLLGGAAMLLNELWSKVSSVTGGLEDGIVEASQKFDSFTVLLLGMDSRPGERVGRTDTIIVAHVEAAQKRLCLLSIPRDTKVYIPGYGVNKINVANVYGGPELVSKIVSDLIGLPVKFYTLTNWEGFKDIVDTLGGVTVDVEKRMYYYDPTDGPEYIIDLKPGVQRLDGCKALQYVRYRNDALGDISRTERQLKFLKALAGELMQPETIVKLPKLVPQVNKSLKTNLGTREMVTLALVAKKFEQMQLVTQTLPGRFLEQGGVSYWDVDLRQAKQVALSLFKDGKVTRVVQGATVKSNVYIPKVASHRFKNKTTDHQEPVNSHVYAGTEKRIEGKNQAVALDSDSEETPAPQVKEDGESESPGEVFIELVPDTEFEGSDVNDYPENNGRNL